PALITAITLRPPPRSTLFPYTTLFRSSSGASPAPNARPCGTAAASAAASENFRQSRRVVIGHVLPGSNRASESGAVRDRLQTGGQAPCPARLTGVAFVLNLTNKLIA